MAKIIDCLKEKEKEKLYHFTKKLLEDRKDISIKAAMSQNSHKKINRRVRQTRHKRC